LANGPARAYLAAMQVPAPAKAPIAWINLVPVLAGCALVAVKFSPLGLPLNTPMIALAAVLLGFAVFASVHHAEVLATRSGEPFGSLILTTAVTIIEVALIISQMAEGKPGAEFIGRDAVLATVMIVLNGIVGISLLSGGVRHHEQAFSLDGATAALSVIGTLSVISLILPNYTIAAPGPLYSASQLGFVGCVSFILYAIFLFVQTVRHPHFFTAEDAAGHGSPASGPAVIISMIFLPLALFVVVMLAKFLSAPIYQALQAAHLPASFLGIIIAAIVLLPESLSALRAARQNDLQTSLNLSLSSAIATIGLTIPALALYSIWQHQQLALGISAASTVLLSLTLFISSVTLATGRTTILQGAVHLVIFGVYIFLSAFP
jgi:Ca2+:H+ antiporter